MKALSTLFSGALFGIGLVLSGLTQPAKVLGFLDVLGFGRLARELGVGRSCLATACGD